MRKSEQTIQETNTVNFLNKKEDYFKSKFWHLNADEANFFGLYYRPIADTWISFILILMGIQNPEAYKNFHPSVLKAINFYYPVGQIKAEEKYKILAKEENEEQKKEFKNIKPILVEVLSGFKNKEISNETTIDELVAWAAEKSIFIKKSINTARKQIKIARNPHQKSCTNNGKFCANFVKPILQNNPYLMFADAKILLFPNLEISSELLHAINKNEIERYRCLENINESYFNTKSLVKWLMKKNYFSEELTYELIENKIETFQETQIDPLSISEVTFTSLEDLTAIGERRNYILQKGIKNETKIFLKFSQKIKYYNKKFSGETKNLPKIRYKGFGQLYKKNEDCKADAKIHGNCTLEMIFMGETPQNFKNKPEYGGKGNILHRIEFIPTEEEAKYQQQPYIEVSPAEIALLISDGNLMVIETKQSLQNQNMNLIELKNDIKKFEENFLKHGNKFESRYMLIQTIIESIKMLQPNFDPKYMPGSVEDFLLICKNISNRVFSISKVTFQECCKGKNRKSEYSPLCFWKSSASSEKNYWDKIQKSLNSIIND